MNGSDSLQHLFIFINLPMKTYFITIKSILILIIILKCSSLSAQTILSGTISDSKTHSPLKNASVYIPELQRATQTDNNGTFSFSDLGKGILRLQSSIVGYKTEVRTIDLSNQQLPVQIEMEPTTMELEEVVVTSNNTSLPDNVPFPVSTISLNALKSYSHPTLMENLAHEPGIDRISLGNGIGKPVIRGLSFNRIMLYSMGTRIENQQWDDRHDLGIVETGIDKVEVVYGPSALIYGADALGGALIFVDEKPAPNGKILGDVNLEGFSNTLGINGDLGLNATSKNGLFFLARIGGTSHTSYIQGKEEEWVDSAANEEDKPFAPNSRFNNLSGKAAIGLSQKWGVTKLSYSYLKAKTGIIEGESADTAAGKKDDRDRGMEPPYQDVSTHVVSLENTFLTGRSHVNFNFAHQLNSRKEFEPVPAGEHPDTPIGLLLHTYTYDLKWTSNPQRKIGFTLGSQGMTQTNRNFGMDLLVPDANVHDFAAYGLIRYDLAKWNFLGGLRFDARSIDVLQTEGGGEGGGETTDSIAESLGIEKPASVFLKHYSPFSFSAGADFHPIDNVTLKANVATGFSAPNYAELSTFGRHEGTYRFEVGEPELKMEQNIEGDLGLIWELNSISLDLSGFYNYITDYIYINPTADSIEGLQVYQYVQNDANISGAALRFDLHPETMKWFDLNSSLAVTSGKLKDGSFLPYIPAHKVFTELRLQKEAMGPLLNAYIALDMDNHFGQNNVAPFETTSDSYTLFDAHIGADFNLGKQRMSMSLFCTNLTNKGYVNNLSLIKAIDVREMGRNFGVQLHVPF